MPDLMQEKGGKPVIQGKHGYGAGLQRKRNEGKTRLA